MTDEQKKPEPVMEAEIIEDDGDKETDGGGIDTSALMTVSRAEFDTQISTAKKYPRSLAKFMKEAKSMATMDQETAGRMYYRLQRRGKDGKKVIEGPSIRLAEVAVAAWGNMLVLSRPVATEDKVVRCAGFAWDLERNNRRGFEITRRITTSKGERFSEDMIVVTQQAASQIAARNAIFGVIPRVFVDQLVGACKKVYAGEGKSLKDMRTEALTAYGKVGAKKEDVFKLAGKKGLEDLDIEALIDLRGLLTAIEEGHTTLKEALSAATDEPTVITPETLSAEAFIKPESVKSVDDAKPPEKKEPVTHQKVEPVKAQGESQEDREIADLFDTK